MEFILLNIQNFIWKNSVKCFFFKCAINLPFNEFFDVIFTNFSVDIIDVLHCSMEFIVGSYGTAKFCFNFFCWSYFIEYTCFKSILIVSRYLHTGGNFFNWFSFLVFLNLFQKAFSIFWNCTINFSQSFDSTRVEKFKTLVRQSIEIGPKKRSNIPVEECIGNIFAVHNIIKNIDTSNGCLFASLSQNWIFLTVNRKIN